MIKIYCCALLLFFTIEIVSQQQEKDSVIELIEVLMIEDFTPREVQGITPSSVIGSYGIKRFGPVDISSSMNIIPGVNFLSGALNTNRIVIRGVGSRTPFGTDKLRMYFDGIPVTNGTGFSTIEAFDLENLGLVEVVKGPKGTTLGANLGGALTLTSKDPDFGKARLSNSFTMGSYNMLKDNLSFRYSELDKFSLGLSYNHFETDGYRQNNRFERDGLLLNAKVNTSPKNEVVLLLNYIDYTAQIPSSLNQTDFEENPTAAASNWLEAQGFEANKYLLMGISNKLQLTDAIKNTSSIFYTYLDHYEPRPFNILDEFTNGYGFRTVFDGRFLNGPEVSFGSEFYRDEYHWSTYQNLFRDNNGNGSLQGEQISRNREFRRQFNLFGTFTFPITLELYFQAGLNLNQTSYDFRDLFLSDGNNTSARRDFKAILLPSFGLQYLFKYGYFYVNVSRGFSNPSLEETLTPDGIINPDIEQEKGVNYEVGGWFRFPKEKISAEFALYRMNINDLLVAQRVGEDQFVGQNAGQTRHQGFEFEIYHRTDISEKLSINPYFTYTFSDHSFVEFVDGDQDFSGNPLTGVPKHRISSGFSLAHSESFSFRINHQFVDEIPLTDANTLSSESYHFFALSAIYQKEFSNHFSLQLNGGVNNLFDTNYAQSVLINAVGFGGNLPRYYYPSNGRNYYLGAQLNYTF
ncbi:TonB-dependent receptor plug domain-containing protein [Allomuricauda sp. d1]|uniref:TonB-dependent receptor family protein n=1 Tax=Allomuricauda sp. d1 TaxID=3136725 RepID=UPI0031DDC614